MLKRNIKEQPECTTHFDCSDLCDMRALLNLLKYMICRMHILDFLSNRGNKDSMDSMDSTVAVCRLAPTAKARE